MRNGLSRLNKVPFFHYTFLDNIDSIISEEQVRSRFCLERLKKSFEDISIDPQQPVRRHKGLDKYIPLFAGFYTLYRGYKLNGYLNRNYDNPKVQNPSFYGSFNETLRHKLGEDYEKVITLLVKERLVYNFADDDKVRLFSNIAVKPDSIEYPVKSQQQLRSKIGECISESNVYCEVDLFDDCKESIKFPSDIEAIIVDNVRVLEETSRKLEDFGPRKNELLLCVSQLPRGRVSTNCF